MWWTKSRLLHFLFNCRQSHLIFLLYLFAELNALLFCPTWPLIFPFCKYWLLCHGLKFRSLWAFFFFLVSDLYFILTYQFGCLRGFSKLTFSRRLTKTNKKTPLFTISTNKTSIMPQTTESFLKAQSCSFQ